MRDLFLRILPSLDNFGHSFALTYKGSEAYQTKLGGLCSLLIKVMTLIMFIVTCKSMILMEDPAIASFSRPLSK